MLTITRRRLINAAITTAGTTVTARFSHAQKTVSSDDAAALAMGHVADHKRVDTADRTEKAAPGGENQKFTGCMIYKRIDEDYGFCPIFTGKQVYANDWCNCWLT